MSQVGLQQLSRSATGPWWGSSFVYFGSCRPMARCIYAQGCLLCLALTFRAPCSATRLLAISPSRVLQPRLRLVFTAPPYICKIFTRPILFIPRLRTAFLHRLGCYADCPSCTHDTRQRTHNTITSSFVKPTRLQPPSRCLPTRTLMSTSSTKTASRLSTVRSVSQSGGHRPQPHPVPPRRCHGHTSLSSLPMCVSSTPCGPPFLTSKRVLTRVHGLQMANAGFFFQPLPSNPDNVVCFLCNKALDGWEEDDRPLEEHLKHAPECGWAITAAVEAELGNYTREDPRDALMSEARKATFAGRWPHENRKGWSCKTKQVRRGSHTLHRRENADALNSLLRLAGNTHPHWNQTTMLLARIAI